MSKRKSKQSLAPAAKKSIQSIYQQRLKQVRTWLKDDHQAILVAREPDLRYLTGFNGEDSMLIITVKRVFLLTDSRFTAQATQQCPWVTIVLRKGPMTTAVAQTCKKLKLKTLRICPQHITLQFDRSLKKSLAGTKLRMLTCPDLAQTFRVNKHADELASIRKAIVIAQQAFNWLKTRIKPGITEQRLAAMLEYKMKLLGAQGVAFKTIVACGKNSALPHSPVGQDTIEAGKPIIIDWGAVVQGYCSNLTRTVVVGTIPPRLRKIYQTVLEAQSRAIATLKAGVKASTADKMVSVHISKAGFGIYFGHGLCHGIGLEVHEQPALSPLSQQILQANMVVTVEPGIYIPGYGGVRIEDDVLITDTACKVLSNLEKQVEQIIIKN